MGGCGSRHGSSSTPAPAPAPALAPAAVEHTLVQRVGPGNDLLLNGNMSIGLDEETDRNPFRSEHPDDYEVPVAFIAPASANTSVQDTSMDSEPMVSTIWLPGEKPAAAHQEVPLLTNSMLGGGGGAPAEQGQVNLGDSVLGPSPGASMVFAEFKVGDAVLFKQRETSHPAEVVVEEVHYPSLDKGPGAEVTYTITLAGRRREVPQARLKLNAAKKGGQIGPGDSATSHQMMSLDQPHLRASGSNKSFSSSAGSLGNSNTSIGASTALAVVTGTGGPAPPQLQAMSPGNSSGLASVSGRTPTRRHPEFRAAVPGEKFVADYDWQEVNDRQIPRGLEVKTFIDGSCPTIARIPSEWRLVVDVNEDFYHRTNVTRHTRIADIKNEIRKERFPGKNMSLTLTASRHVISDDNLTIESASIFGKKMACKAVEVQ